LNIFKEQILLTKYGESGNKASQINIEQIEVMQSLGQLNQEAQKISQNSQKISHGFQEISDIDLSQNNLLVTSKNTFKIFDNSNGELIGNFTAKNLQKAKLLANLVITVEAEEANSGPIVKTSNSVYIRSFQGAKKNSIAVEGNAVDLSVSSKAPVQSQSQNHAQNHAQNQPNEAKISSQISYISILSDKNKIFTFSCNRNSNGNIKPLNLKPVDYKILKPNTITMTQEEANALAKSNRISQTKISPNGSSILIKFASNVVIAYFFNKEKAVFISENADNFGYDFSDDRLIFVTENPNNQNNTRSKKVKTFFLVEDSLKAMVFEDLKLGEIAGVGENSNENELNSSKTSLKDLI